MQYYEHDLQHGVHSTCDQSRLNLKLSIFQLICDDLYFDIKIEENFIENWSGKRNYTLFLKYNEI